MDIKVLQGDTVALMFVQKALGRWDGMAQKNGVVTLEYHKGGPKAVAVFSLPSSRMYFATGGGRLAVDTTPRAMVSIYGMENIRRVALMTEKIGNETSAKDWNKLMRAKLTPKMLLEMSAGFVALNASANIDGLDLNSLASQILALSRHNVPSHLNGRGGAIVHLHLPTNRVAMAANPAIGHIPVRYGSSTIAYVSDVLCTLKAAHVLNLPMVFDTDGDEVFWDYLRNILSPSARIFGSVNSTLWNDRSYAVTGAQYIVTSQWADNTFKALRLTNTTNLAADMAKDKPSAQIWCQRGLNEVVSVFKKHLGIRVNVKFTDSAKIREPFLEYSLGGLAIALQQTNGHSVSILNSPSGERISTDRTGALGNRSLGSLLEEGYRAGGALSYFVWYQQAESTPYVAFMGDKDAGLVHLMARDQMLEGNLWAVPGGMLGIYPKSFDGNVTHTSVDPWVLLELFSRAKDVRAMVRKIWDAIEVPLEVERIGFRTYVVISSKGVEVVKNSPGKHLE